MLWFGVFSYESSGSFFHLKVGMRISQFLVCLLHCSAVMPQHCVNSFPHLKMNALRLLLQPIRERLA